MREKESSKLKWRKLDNSAKLFPILSNKKFSTVFRISIVLHQPIEQERLQEAVERTVNDISSFKVRLRKGFFWYYLEHNSKNPIVEEEMQYPCKYIDKEENNNYLFKVTYYECKINLDVFHSLTDGTTALEFLKAIAYCYFDLKRQKNADVRIGTKQIDLDTNNTEDSYIKNYEKHLGKNNSTKKAYLLKGKKLPLYGVGVTHIRIHLKEVIKLCRTKKVTVTQYFTALLIKAIYDGNTIGKKNKKPIKICIPVNLKNYFDSTTITNFFSYITVEADTNQIAYFNFDQILEFVKEDFKRRLTKEEIAKTMSGTVSLGNNIVIRLIPLFLKKFTVKISYIEIRKYTTTTFSNLGKINVLPEYENEVKGFLFLIAPEKGEKIKCSACSYEDNIDFTITSILEEPKVEKSFTKQLKEQNIPFWISTNGVYQAEKEQKLYPTLHHVNKSHLAIRICFLISIFLSITCFIVNIATGNHLYWSIIATLGIMYVWITSLYAIKKNVTIASHVMLQTIVVSILAFLLDIVIGYRGWSLAMALPIIIITANSTMLILLIVSHKKYFRYLIYQLIIFLWSMLPIVLVIRWGVQRTFFLLLSTIIAIIVLAITILVCGKDVKEEIKRRFHF